MFLIYSAQVPKVRAHLNNFRFLEDLSVLFEPAKRRSLISMAQRFTLPWQSNALRFDVLLMNIPESSLN